MDNEQRLSAIKDLCVSFTKNHAYSTALFEKLKDGLTGAFWEEAYKNCTVIWVLDWCTLFIAQHPKNHQKPDQYRWERVVQDSAEFEEGLGQLTENYNCFKDRMKTARDKWAAHAPALRELNVNGLEETALRTVQSLFERLWPQDDNVGNLHVANMTAYHDMCVREAQAIIDRAAE